MAASCQKAGTIISVQLRTVAVRIPDRHKKKSNYSLEYLLDILSYYMTVEKLDYPVGFISIRR